LLAAYSDEYSLRTEYFINGGIAEVVKKPVSLGILKSIVGQLCNSAFTK